ncbi:MAG: hypothetical protein WBF03_22135 [Xanthobacteraceae bacterium]
MGSAAKAVRPTKSTAIAAAVGVCMQTSEYYLDGFSAEQSLITRFAGAPVLTALAYACGKAAQGYCEVEEAVIAAIQPISERSPQPKNMLKDRNACCMIGFLIL